MTKTKKIPVPLSTSNPELCKEWDYNKNAPLTPDQVSSGSGRKVWWKCAEGHNWSAIVNNRSRGSKCPYCANRTHFLYGDHHRLIVGENDLETWCKQNHREDIIFEYDIEKNGGLLPCSIKYGSGKKIWWTCSECGNSWCAPVNNRTSHNAGCPECKRKYGTSFCEQAVYYYVKQLFSDAINGDVHLGVELDIFIPSISTAVEYDGEIWHKSNKKVFLDDKKSKTCVENGITLIRIREPNIPAVDNCFCLVRNDSVSDKSLSIVIEELLHYLNPNIEILVDVSNDNSYILAQYATKQYKNSLAYCYPEIAKKWHPIKNGMLTSDKISKMSAHKVWWKDDCGHEYNMAVNLKTRSDKPSGCPICARKKRGSKLVKKVYCIETGILFDSLAEASISVQTNRNTITHSCKDRRKTAGGFHWSFVDEKGQFDSTILEKKKSNDEFINKRVGMCRLMNCGMKCTIISYKNANNIDVEFEDGYIAYKKNYANFLKGGINNPNMNNHIGETITTKSGYLCTVIEYRNYNDIDVQFADGTLVSHRNYGAFVKGEIGYPGHNLSIDKSRNMHIGETKMMNCGMSASIIMWNGYNDIDVCFEDGTIAAHKSYSNYKRGKITNPNVTRKCDITKRAKHIGETKMMNCGMNAAIVAWNSQSDIDITFEDGTVAKSKSYSNFLRGKIRNPNIK